MSDGPASDKRPGLERLSDIATVVIAIAAIAVAASVGWERFGPPGVGSAMSRPDREVDGWEEIVRGGHWRGPRGAQVVIVEFGDYECPFCRRAEEKLAMVRDAYPRDVATVYRHRPLSIHPNAYRAARLAECGADQGAFYSVHDVLYRAITLSGLEAGAVASAAGVPDSVAFVTCAEALEPPAALEADIELAGRLGIEGVPGILINGTLLGVPPDSATLLHLVEEQLVSGLARR